jgi:hypothetical protein
MKAIAMFLLFLGIIMIINGIYQQQYNNFKKNVKIEYRFIPRTYYEEQLAENESVTANFKNMFQKESPWFERNVTLPKPDKNQSNFT